MRTMKVWFLLVFALGLVGREFLKGMPQKEISDDDRFGKVFVQVIDAIDGAPVNEKFLVYFFNTLQINPHDLGSIAIEWRQYTDNKGHLECPLKPGIYYLQFLPDSCQSKYELGPSPILYELNRLKIKVERGKITKVVKKVNYGGSLKVILVDPSGKKINPRVDYSKDIDISFGLKAEGGIVGVLIGNELLNTSWTCRKDDLNDGELLIGRLYPGNYQMSIYFWNLGYKGKTIKDIRISRAQTTEKEVVIDLNDRTGIEGYVTDLTGKPVKGFSVKIDNAEYKTDTYGYYRIVGLDEGVKKIEIYNSLVDEGDISIFKIFDVEIKMNTIIRKDFSIKIE